jgi:putative endonuclease
LPPVFARVVEESEGARAGALAKADTFLLCAVNGASYNSASQFMHYVYILQSEIDKGRFYTGLTDDLRKRLRNHNVGRVVHSRKWKPWRLKNYTAFSERLRAAEFERYLKSASGRAFVRKHL